MDHPDVATSLNNLAKVYLKIDKDKAKQLGKQALEMRTRLQGEDSPIVIKLKAEWENEL